jgi:hypothetical protein
MTKNILIDLDQAQYLEKKMGLEKFIKFLEKAQTIVSLDDRVTNYLAELKKVQNKNKNGSK